MRGLVKHEKRNMLIITLVFTIVDIFITTMEIYFWERSISIMNYLL